MAAKQHLSAEEVALLLKMSASEVEEDRTNTVKGIARMMKKTLEWKECSWSLLWPASSPASTTQAERDSLLFLDPEMRGKF